MAIAGELTWGVTTATVYVGQTVTVPIVSTSNKNEVPGFGSAAVADIASSSTTELVIEGLEEGTLAIPAGTTWTESSPAMDMETTNSFTLTVLPDNPKIATDSQWADLASRVKAKSDVTITMTDTDPGEGSALAENNYVAVYGGDPIIMDYSTAEINTGAKWVDGSEIYKKTINFGALPNASYKSVAHGITNLSYVIEISGMTYDGNRFRPLIVPNAGGGAWTVPEVDLTSVYIYAGTDQSSQTAYITLYYTKSS